MNNAFLNGELEEEVNMEQPLRFDEARIHGEVFKLRKSLYGLELSHGFNSVEKDPCQSRYFLGMEVAINKSVF